MALKVHPISVDQVPACVEIYSSAFGPNAANRAMYPNGHTPQVLSFLTARDFERVRSERNSWFIGATDTRTGELVAYARWRLEDQVEHQKERERKEGGEKEPELPNSSRPAVTFFFSTMDQAHEKAMGTRTHWRE